MSNKKSFRAVFSMNGKDTKCVRFAVGSGDTASDALRAMGPAFGGKFNVDTLNALGFVGVNVVLKQDNKTHKVDSCLVALKWVLGEVR